MEEALTFSHSRSNTEALSSKPDKDAYPEAWEAAWDKHLFELYGPNPTPVNVLRAFSTSPEQEFHILSVLIPEEEGERANSIRTTSLELIVNIWTLQLFLSVFVISKQASYSMDRAWRDLSVKGREELVQRGLHLAMVEEPGNEKYRILCPDMTIRYLADNPTAFVNIINMLLPQASLTRDHSPMLKPLYIPHPSVDEVLSGPTPPVMRSFAQLHRSYFITLASWYMVLGLYGTDENTALETHTWRTKPGDDNNVNVKRLPKFIRDYYRNSGQKGFCWECCHTPDASKEIKLMMCVKCAKAGLKIQYCSRECQTSDWKSGDPVPHKNVCSDVLFWSRLFGIDALFPKPLQTYKRTPALDRQISLIKQHAAGEYDYFFPTRNRQIVGIAWPSDFRLTRGAFIAMRRRAVADGNRPAITEMYHLLAPWIRRYDISLATVIKQFRLEYGFEVNPQSKPMEYSAANLKENIIVGSFLESRDDGPLAPAPLYIPFES